MDEIGVDREDYPDLTNATAEQNRAVLSRHANILCVAGPGSGKTQTLTWRVQQLIAEGVDPHQVICITYTNAGATALQERLGEEIKLRYCGTLHGYCLSLMQQHGGLLGYADRVTVLQLDEPRNLSKDKAEWKPATVILDEVRQAVCPKATLSSLLKLRQQPQPEMPMSKEEVAIAKYIQRMRQESCADFEMILRDGVKIAPLAEPVEHLLWDEVQDSGELDMEFCNAHHARNRFWVGDFKQSIFGFRGARAENIVDLFHRDDVEKIKLELNFRSDKLICHHAQNLIENSPDGDVVGRSIPVSQENGTVQVFHYPSQEAEAIAISAQVEKWIGVVPSVVAEDGRIIMAQEIAVLTRNNAQAAVIAERLKTDGIPVREREQNVQDTTVRLRAAIQMLNNPSDIAVCEFLRHEKTTAFIADLKREARMKQQPIRCFYEDRRIPRRSQSELWGGELLDVLARMDLRKEEVSAARDAMTKIVTPNLNSLVMSLFQPEAAEVGSGVTVTTFHGAKGREWDHVWMAACEDAIIPSHRKNGDINEERRIMYVGMTRSRHNLVLSWSTKRQAQWGDWQKVEHQPSRFLEEAGLL